jgi:class 3 adenylate cyclase
MGGSSQSRRSLAAIVFTDIVEYSALVQKNEDMTLKLANRDLNIFKKLCDRYEGKVLKSTGDGLLIFFESAVQAVACSLRMQEAVSIIAQKVPPDRRLSHRIGVHLGDVFVSPDDVMGDGVNIASRIQEEAEPGGICISQTVYDVVKNRLGLKVVPLGARELKNIKESVPIYRIVLDAADMEKAGRVSELFAAKRKWILSGAAVAAAAAALLLVFLPDWGEGDTGQGKGDDVNQTAQDRPIPPKPQPYPGPHVPKDKLPEPADPDMMKVVEEARRRFLPNRDFDGLVKFLEKKGFGESKYCKCYVEISRMNAAVDSQLKSHTKDNPLEINMDGIRGKLRGRIWCEDDRIAIDIEGQVKTERFTLDQLPWGLKLAAFFRLAKTDSQRMLVAFLSRELKEIGLLRKGRLPHHRPRPKGRGPK